jgi:hypothetical protein
MQVVRSQAMHGSSSLGGRKLADKPCEPNTAKGPQHGMSVHPFGSLAARGSPEELREGPWLCAPALRRVCRFEDEEVTERYRCVGTLVPLAAGIKPPLLGKLG